MVAFRDVKSKWTLVRRALEANTLKLGSTTISEAEIEALDAVVPGQSGAGKAVVLDEDGTIDAIDIDALSIGGTAVTADAAELNRLDGATAGTAVASKAAVLDANKDFTGLHKLTITQEVAHAFQKTQTKSANYTIAEGDSGQVTIVDTDGVVITLPATAAGLTVILVNGGADGAVGFSVSPNASDKIMGAGLTSADDKDITNTKATAKKGDMVMLVGDGADGWWVQKMHGTWAREG